MSYNIDSSNTLTLDAWMRAADVVAFRRELSDELPECHLLVPMIAAAEEALVRGEVDARIRIEKFWWYGEGSGRAWGDVFIPSIAPKIMGLVEGILTWEGGDSFSGFRIRDGVFTAHEVVQSLGPETK